MPHAKWSSWGMSVALTNAISRARNQLHLSGCYAAMHWKQLEGLEWGFWKLYKILQFGHLKRSNSNNFKCFHRKCLLNSSIFSVCVSHPFDSRSFGSLSTGCWCLRCGNANNEPQQWGNNANMEKMLSLLLPPRLRQQKQQSQLEK